MIFRCLSILIMAIILITSIPLSVYGEQEILEDQPPGNIIRAEVIEINDTQAANLGNFSSMTKKELLTVKIIDSQFRGEILQLPYGILRQPGYNITVKPGDEVLLQVEANDKSIKNAHIIDYGRDKILLGLVSILALLLVLFGGKQGVKSIFALSITVAAVFIFLLPLIYYGYNPILATVFISVAVITITFLMIGGLSKKPYRPFWAPLAVWWWPGYWLIWQATRRR